MNTSTALAPTGPAVPAQRLNDEQVELLKRQIAPGASDDELKLFVQVCNRTGLDPFARQIYALKRRAKEGDQWVEKLSFQISIDGARLIAERSGRYRPGEYYWCGEDGVWHETWMSGSAPKAAKAIVYKDGHPVGGIAHFGEYAQRNRKGELAAMWGSMPRLMIAKCAEMLALRKAFPQELSGLYTPEEIPVSEEHVYPEVPRAELEQRNLVPSEAAIEASPSIDPEQPPPPFAGGEPEDPQQASSAGPADVPVEPDEGGPEPAAGSSTSPAEGSSSSDPVVDQAGAMEFPSGRNKGKSIAQVHEEGDENYLVWASKAWAEGKFKSALVTYVAKKSLGGDS